MNIVEVAGACCFMEVFLNFPIYTYFLFAERNSETFCEMKFKCNFKIVLALLWVMNVAVAGACCFMEVFLATLPMALA